MAVIKKQHTKVNFSNKNIKVRYIVIHDTGVKGQSAKNNADYFEKTYRGASAHYFVDENEIIEVVPAGKVGWHVGDDKSGDSHDIGDLINNNNSIGIEFCAEKDGTFKAETLANGAFLVQKLMKDHGVAASKVVRHYDASGKNCPQFMNQDKKWTLWKKVHSQLTGQTSVKAPTGTFTGKNFTHKVVAGDTLWGLSKQYNATIAQLKEWNNLKSDTIVIGDMLKIKASNKSTDNPKHTETVAAKKHPLPNATYWVKKPLFRGKGVRQVQEALASIYFYPEKGAKNNGVDGYYGAKTADAVKRFQSVNGLKADGSYGPATKKVLDKKVNK